MPDPASTPAAQQMIARRDRLYQQLFIGASSANKRQTLEVFRECHELEERLRGPQIRPDTSVPPMEKRKRGDEDDDKAGEESSAGAEPAAKKQR